MSFWYYFGIVGTVIVSFIFIRLHTDDNTDRIIKAIETNACQVMMEGTP